MRKSLIVLASALLTQAFQQAFAWQIERPYTHEHLDIYDQLKQVQNSNTDGRASVGLGVAVGNYYENDMYYGGDVIEFNVSMTANSRKHIAYSEDCPFWWVPEEHLWYKNIMTGVGEKDGLVYLRKRR